MLTFEEQRYEVENNLGSQYTRYQLLKLATPHGGRVLDIGSQTADNLGPFSQYDLYGFDIEFTREASQRKRTVMFATASATAIPFKDCSFDVILMNHVLEHITDEQLALQEAQRVLKNDGLLWLACPTSYSGKLKPGETERHGHVRAYNRRSLISSAQKQLSVCSAQNPGRVLWAYHRLLLPFFAYVNRVQMKLYGDKKLLWQRPWMVKVLNPLLRGILFPIEDLVAPLSWWPGDYLCDGNTALLLSKK